MLINRDRAAELGCETVGILKAGFYATAAGKAIEIRELVQRAVEGTCSYPPDVPLPQIPPGGKETCIEVENQTTLGTARRLVEEGHRPVALNFASANHPGGGFLSGARAQEESLARSSALYACLVDDPMYDFHRSRADPMYTDYAIYSPDVPVFRTDDGTLLDQPYLCSFITAPAVNANVVLARASGSRSEIRVAMSARIQKVLTIAGIHGHETVVLGAWGCGAFGNDSHEIAELFHQALAGAFRRVFAKVIFAIIDWSEDNHFIGPFRSVFENEK
jgi:uncharacterized protein (TIGR02452 family)